MRVMAQASYATTESAKLRSPGAAVAAAANAGGGAGATQTPYHLTVELKVDREVLGKQVLTLVDGQCRQAGFGQA